MAGFRSLGRKRSEAPTRPGNAGGDASRFAAANLPPYKAPPPGAGHGARSEPGPGLSQEALAAKAAAAQYDALFGSGSQPARRRSPMLVMSLVFAIGAGVGLAGAKWFASGSKYPAVSVPPVALSAPPATVVDTDGQARALRGIRASELPYDGRTAGQDEDEVGAAPQPEAVTARESKVPAAQEPKAGAVQEPAAPRQEPIKAAEESKEAPRPPAAGLQESKAAAVRDQKQIQDTERKHAEAAPAPAKQAKRAETPPRKATRTAKSGKDKDDGEIDRMRRQADDELNKKTASASQNPRRSGEPSRLQQVSSALASCDRRSNIIAREHCRWQVCNGMWGKNGCPSYASARRDPYAY